MSNKVVAFPDTNVLLHGKALQSVPWLDVLHADEVVLVMASSVLDELDRKMHDGPPTLRARAKKRAKMLHELRTGAWLGHLPSGVSVEFATVPRASTYTDHELDREWRDDRLFAAIIERESIDPGCCMVVTIDYNMTSRADAYGIPWHLLDAKYRLPVPPDSAVAQLQRDVDAMKQAQRLAAVRVTPGPGAKRIDLRRPSFDALTEAQFKKLMDEMRENHPRMAQLPQGFAHSYAVRFERNPEDYNAELEKAYERYAAYLRELEAHRYLTQCTTAVRLAIVNEGSVPARDVQVHLTLEAAGLEFVDPQRLGKAPKPPEFPERQRNAFANIAMLGGGYTSRLSVPSPKPSRELTVVDAHRAIYELDMLMHGLPETVEIPVLVNPSSAESGALRYVTYASEQPKPASGEIAVVVDA